MTITEALPPQNNLRGLSLKAEQYKGVLKITFCLLSDNHVELFHEK